MPLLTNRTRRRTTPVETDSTWLSEAVYELDHSPASLITVDLSSVDAIATEQLNELIRIHVKAKQAGRSLVLQNVQDQVTQVFMLTRLDRLFRIDEAYASASAGAPVQAS